LDCGIELCANEKIYLAGLDFLRLVKLANFVRSEVQAGKTQLDISSATVFEDDRYLKPVLPDDALLYSLDDVFEGDGGENDTANNEVDELREQLSSLQSQFAAYREQVQNAMLDRLETNESAGGPSKQAKSDEAEAAATETYDKGYFSSYSYNSIHEIMIKDRVRTDAYRDFIYDHKDLFRDKVVLDVGCGTGILSMFCAKAGAKLVVAVDNSDIIDKARENVFRNGLQDQIKCLRGKVEEVTLPVEKVDVIVSEWMGYCLLYESMLDSVLYARDRYLTPDGLMVPSHATLRIAPLADSDLKATHIDFWRDVYGFDMTAMLERAHEEVVVRVLDRDELTADNLGVDVPFLELDLHTTKVEDLTFTQPFAVTYEEKGDGGDDDGGDASKSKRLEGFVVWFDIIFGTSRSVMSGMTAPEAREKKGLVTFSTGPYSPATHWQQGIFLIENPADELAPGDKVRGQVTYLKKEGQERSLDIEIAWGKGDGQVKRQMWVLD
jgi:protein arginine N-methyltransferase 3